MGTDLGPSDKWQGLLPRRRRSPQSSSGGICKRRSWSAQAMRHSNALDLEADISCFDSPREIAASLKRSSEHSQTRR